MFRKSGSIIAFAVDGKLPDPRREGFTQALAAHRFRTIETAASEEHSLGWVTADDPTGDTFDLDAIDLDAGFWLRVRIDQKRLPTAWIAIHRSVAERSAGRPLSARERKELRADLCEKLLPRALPAVHMVDALLTADRRRVLLFTTSKRVREEFVKLFFKTFAVSLEQLDPYALARAAGLGADAAAYLDEVAPVAWPRDREPRARVREAVPDFATADTAEEAP